MIFKDLSLLILRERWFFVFFVLPFCQNVKFIRYFHFELNEKQKIYLIPRSEEVAPFCEIKKVDHLCTIQDLIQKYTQFWFLHV